MQASSGFRTTAKTVDISHRALLPRGVSKFRCNHNPRPHAPLLWPTEMKSEMTWEGLKMQSWCSQQRPRTRLKFGSSKTSEFDGTWLFVTGRRREGVVDGMRRRSAPTLRAATYATCGSDKAESHSSSHPNGGQSLLYGLVVFVFLTAMFSAGAVRCTGAQCRRTKRMQLPAQHMLLPSWRVRISISVLSEHIAIASSDELSHLSRNPWVWRGACKCVCKVLRASACAPCTVQQATSDNRSAPARATECGSGNRDAGHAAPSHWRDWPPPHLLTAPAHGGWRRWRCRRCHPRRR